MDVAVVVDFDGTVTERAVSVMLLERFGRDHALLRRGFLEFGSHLRGLGFPLAVASEGLDLYVNEVLEHNKVDYVNVFCNEATRSEGGRLRVHYPQPSLECSECGNCKSGLVKSLREDGNYVVFIGNGRTDLCPAKEANLVFATDGLAVKLQNEGQSFILFEDFFDIMDAWDSVVAHG